MTTEYQINDGGLIVTFYGAHGKLGSLLDRLRSELKLEPDPRPGMTGGWYVPNTYTSLSSFDPPDAPDTSVVQLILGEPGEATCGWQTMHNKLTFVPLNDIMALKDENDLHIVWGYTLVYEAVLAPGIACDQNLVKPLLDFAKHLGKTPDPPVTLAHSRVCNTGGAIWLINRAIEYDGLDAANVYIALATSKKEEDHLIEQILLKEQARLLMPDLIAHKGYHQIRQYTQGNYIQHYKNLLRELLTTTDRLLDQSRQEAISVAEIEKLSHLLDRLVSKLPGLERLYVSLKRQVYNYLQWRDFWLQLFEDDKIFERHLQKMGTMVEDLELNVTEGKSTLEAVRIASEMIQLRMDKATEQRQQAIGILLAVIATALSVPQIIDREAVRLLTFVGACVIGKPAAGSECYDLALLSGQIMITVIAALAVGLVIKIVGDRRQKRNLNL